MKKPLMLLVTLLVCALIIVGCSQSTSTSVTTTSKSSIPPSSVTATTTSTQATATPRYGGNLRIIRGAGPLYMGYTPKNDDRTYTQFVTQRLYTWDIDGNILPQLASSWETDPANKTVTFHLQKGVKFTDGSDFNAKSAKWNMDRYLAGGRFDEGNKIKSIDVIDDYTVRISLTDLTSLAVVNYGWIDMFSQEAFEKNGEEWANTHQVGVGPFQTIEWIRDASISFRKVDNFWMKGYPYLDGITFRFIPDSMTASAMMQAGEADMWLEPPAQDARDLQSKGFTLNQGPGMFWALWPNSKNPSSPFANKKVREALEYAIDRPALTQALGFGLYEPFTQIAPKQSYGYISGYNPRPYNPEKAKQLLADAGYPNGINTEILCRDDSKDFATAIQAYLAKVNIVAKVDIADRARYNSIFSSRIVWNGLAVGYVGIDADFIVGLLRHFGARPMTGIEGMQKSPEFLALFDKALANFDPEVKKKIAQDIVRQASEDALVVPIYRLINCTVMAPYVHSDYDIVHNTVFTFWDDWMEKTK